MKKKFLLAVLFLTALCVSVAIRTGISYTYASEHKELILASDEVTYFDNVNKSIELYEIALKPYLSKTLIRSEEVLQYRNDFGGTYIDSDGILNIGIVGLQSITKSFGGQAIYQPQRFQYKYLLSVQRELSFDMLKFEITMLSIDEQKNVLNVYLNDESHVGKIIESLIKKDLYNDSALHFIRNNDAQIMEETTVYGGDRLNTSDF